MAPSRRPSKRAQRKPHQTPQVGWESLCDDVKQLVLSKLTLRDLASAAGTCRAFRKACQARLEQERAPHLAAAEESFGTPLFHALVTALHRTLHGRPPCPELAWKEKPRRPGKTKQTARKWTGPPWDHVLLSEEGEAERRTRGDADNIRLTRLRPCAVMSNKVVFNSGDIVKLFPGTSASDPTSRPRAYMEAHASGEWYVDVDEEAFVPTLGLLMAACTHITTTTTTTTPEAQLAPLARRLLFEFNIRGWAHVDDEEEEEEEARWEEWVAHWEGRLEPLRHLAKSILYNP